MIIIVNVKDILIRDLQQEVLLKIMEREDIPEFEALLEERKARKD